MLVLPPFSATLVVQVLTGALTIALTGVLVAIANSTRPKIRAQKLLAPIPGPKGVFLLGIVPEFVKNVHRVYDFQVSLFAAVHCTYFRIDLAIV